MVKTRKAKFDLMKKSPIKLWFEVCSELERSLFAIEPNFMNGQVCTIEFHLLSLRRSTPADGFNHTETINPDKRVGNYNAHLDSLTSWDNKAIRRLIPPKVPSVQKIPAACLPMHHKRQ